MTLHCSVIRIINLSPHNHGIFFSKTFTWCHHRLAPWTYYRPNPSLKHPGVKCLIQVLIGSWLTSYRDHTTNLLVTNREHKPLHQLMTNWNLKMMAYSPNIKDVHGYFYIVKYCRFITKCRTLPLSHTLSLWIWSDLYFSVFQFFISIKLLVIWLWCIITPWAWAFSEKKIIITFWQILRVPVWRRRNDSR